ncbi:hypothetical protein MXAN_6946 [Myxococcus xanthus DK 1622]|uniref:Uncharacterized protein n=1 Tax=Myxococcus xanthus (strain DK1622) TaxID=246197 RepID=Q1CX12_MYXXD|nr:hypothetical protein MXAN_6946 [Myxococcus xanthus DK 1622]
MWKPARKQGRHPLPWLIRTSWMSCWCCHETEMEFPS